MPRVGPVQFRACAAHVGGVIRLPVLQNSAHTANGATTVITLLAVRITLLVYKIDYEQTPRSVQGGE